MTIATRLKLNILLSAAVVLILSSAFLTAFLVERKASERVDFADRLSRGVYDLSLLTDNYIRHQEDRPKVQWKIRYESLSDLLQEASSEMGQDELLPRMSQDLKNAGQLFNELVAAYEGSRSGEPAISELDEQAQKAKQEQLVDLITIKLRSISAMAARITMESNEAIQDVSRNIAVLFSVLAAAMLILAVWFSMRIRRVIAGPIGRLREGTEIIRQGDLDHRIAVASDDELGQLSKSFNQMTEYLKKTTVSRDELLDEVSMRKRAEQEIRRFNTELERLVSERTAKLEVTNRELESFSYSVSHDLRAPLRAIEGFTRILTEEYSGRLDDEGKRITSIIIDNVKKMSRLIDDLLAFSRVGRYEIKFTPVDMEAMVRAVFSEIVSQKDAQRITFIVHSLPGAYADMPLIRQVWANLVSNAVKFTSRREKPVIEVGGKIEDSDTIIYYIKDNGVGFDMAYAGKLFGVFQRLHSVKEFEGTGIGLAVVHRIILRHGGKIWAEATPGQGATFFFSLPLYKPEAEESRINNNET